MHVVIIYFFTVFIVPWVNNIICKPKRFNDFSNENINFDKQWEEELAFLDTLSPYCLYYNKIFEGFFESGSNTFFEITSFTLQVMFAGLLVELVFLVILNKKIHEIIVINIILQRLGIYFVLCLFIWGIGIY